MSRPLPPHTEPLDGGVVNARDATALQPGELQVAEDAYYPPNDSAIRRVPAPAQGASIPEGNKAISLHHIAFDRPNEDSTRGYLIARSPTAFYLSDGDADSAAFSSTALSTDPTDRVVASRAAVVHHSNNFFFLDGKNRNQVATAKNIVDATTPSLIRHGLKAVSASPTVTQSADQATDVWHADEGLGWFWYWTTEYDRDNDVESTFDGEPAGTNLSTLRRYITVVAPGILNPSAVAWRLYRARTSTPVPPALSDGSRIAEIDRDITSYIDKGDLASYLTDWELPTAVASGGSGWAALSGLFDVGGTVAIAPLASPVKLSGFAFDTASILTPIKKVIVEVRCGYRIGSLVYPLALTRAHIGVSGDAGSTWSPSGGSSETDPMPLTHDNEVLINYADLQVEIDDEDFLATLGPSSFSATNFWLNLIFHGDPDENPTIYVSHIRVRVQHSGASFEESEDVPIIGEQFPTIAVQSPGQLVSVVGRNGDPPIATTGAVFEDCLVLNDVADPSIVRYSPPGLPHYFPSLYTVNLETDPGDIVRCLVGRHLGLIVGMENHICRINYFPTGEESEFHRGRVWDIVSPNHGIVGPDAATLLQLDGQQEVLAFYDRAQGVCATDGFRVWSLVEGFAWDKAVNDGPPVRLCILVNYPRWHSLVLYYPDRGADFVNRKLIMSYEPAYVRRTGRLRVTGPCRIPEIASACVVRRSADGAHVAFITRTGHLWFEDRANGDPAHVGVKMRVMTREMLLSGVGYQTNVQSVYTHFRDFSGIAPFRMIVHAEESDSMPTPILHTRVLAQARGFWRQDIGDGGVLAEGHSIEYELTSASSDIALDHVTLVGNSLGPEI